MKTKKSICIFLHYFPKDYIPLYVKLYIESLEQHFDEMFLVCNKRKLDVDACSFIEKRSVLFVDNEGYDFGMFYKAIAQIDLNNYHAVACVNDSNFIFNDLHKLFTWAHTQPVDFWGLIDSYQMPSLYSKGSTYHIQSHFIVFRERAVNLLSCFLEGLDVKGLLEEKDSKILRKKVIAEWEVGISQFLLDKGLICKAFIDCEEYAKKMNVERSKNISILGYDKIVNDGYPVVKRCIISHSKSKSVSWKNIIRTYGNPDWDIERLIVDIEEVSFVFRRKNFLIRIATLLKHFIKAVSVS